MCLHHEPRVALQPTLTTVENRLDSSSNPQNVTPIVADSNTPTNPKLHSDFQTNPKLKNNCHIHTKQVRPHQQLLNLDLSKSQTFNAFDLLDLNMRQNIALKSSSSKSSVEKYPLNQKLYYQAKLK